jgi:hypothetical protein
MGDCTMATGDVRRGTPALIAVSSFGEGLPRVTPLTAPGEAPLTPTGLPLLGQPRSRF